MAYLYYYVSFFFLITATGTLICSLQARLR